MAKSQPRILTFNGGVISPLALARQDLERLSRSAEEQTNWMPRHLGSMMLRPGLKFVESITPEKTNRTITVDVGGNKTTASSTGLSNSATVYTAKITWAGFDVNISIIGANAQTYNQLIDEIWDDFSGFFGEDLVVQVLDGNIVFTYMIEGENPNSMSISDVNPNQLFHSLTNFSSIGSDVNGQDDIESDAKIIPFIFSKDYTAKLIFVGNELRIMADEAYIAPTGTVSTELSNGNFLTVLTDWTDLDDSGGVSTWAAGDDCRGYLSLVGTIFNYARREQVATVAVNDRNEEHQCQVVVARGPVNIWLRAAGLTRKQTLSTGIHNIMFTPAGNTNIQLEAATKYASLIDYIYFARNNLSFDTEYTEDDLPLIRSAQSGNYVYLACEGKKPKIVQRVDERSWSFYDYQPEDGPFLPYNATGITMTPSGLSGDITITSSQNFFDEGHVGALMLIDSSGQKVTSSIGGANQFSNTIRVTGTTRSFFLTISSIGSNTVSLQRSGDETSWTDVSTYTTNQTNTVINDNLDNQILFYRIGIKTGNYVGGTTVVTLEYSQGSISGVAKVVSYTSETVVNAIVLREFGGTSATVNWREGAWSDFRGWPSAVALYEGRLWWAGKQRIWGSVSDSYESFDDTIEGDSRAISRTIGTGTADNINWMVGALNLLLATDSRILAARSSVEDAPLTQDDFSLKDISSQGSARANPVKVGNDIAYIQNSGTRVMRLAWNGAQYIDVELTAATPEIGEPSLTHLAVQHQPDVRIHCVRSDGKTVVLLFDPIEELAGFIPIETDGEIQDVVVLPGDVEDTVYYVVKRTIPLGENVTTAGVVRYIEKFALESECQGGTQNKQLDSFILRSGSSTTILSGLSHLNGMSVYVYGSGVVQGPYTVSSGIINVGTAVTNVVIGMTYTARYKSVKLGRLMDKKIIPQIGLLMRNVHPYGIEIGQDFDHLVGIPKADWEQVAGLPSATTVIEDYHKEFIPIDGKWTMDSRICLQATAPYPVTVLAALVNLESDTKQSS